MQSKAVAPLDQLARNRRFIRWVAPETPDQLHGYVTAMLGFNLPRTPMAPGHDAPFDYLVHAFFGDHANSSAATPDCVVWANRGGGKTQLGAIATLLDLLFKPGIQIRILGGSFEQSSKMYRYLKQMLERDAFNDLIAGNLTGRYVELINGSRVEVLSQSQCAVRGQRVHKLRCDEVDLFDPEVWEAAQLVTRSGRCDNVHVRASIEALSTMHQPYGLMQKIVRQADNGGRRVFRWSVLDTLRRCEPARSCQGCLLWNECQGRAKSPATRGFIDIDDAIQQKHRVGEQTWKAEMLCERPNVSDMVYPEFDPQVHVFGENETLCVGGHASRKDLSARQPPHASRLAPDARLWIGGVDFGYRGLTVLLWACVDANGVVRVMDELALEGQIVERVIDQAKRRMEQRGWPRPEWIGADPAGHQRNDHSGTTTIALWRRAGFAIRTRAMRIEPGIQAVRRRLRMADGSVRLFIHRRCEKLIESMTKYHYPPHRPDSSTPVKDGNDHAADALRYMIVNLDCGFGEPRCREY